MLFITKNRTEVKVDACDGAKLTPSWAAACVARELHSARAYNHVRAVRTKTGHEIYGLNDPGDGSPTKKEFIVSIRKDCQIDRIGVAGMEYYAERGLDYARQYASPADVGKAVRKRMAELGARDIASRVYVAGPKAKELIMEDDVLERLTEVIPVPVSEDVAADLLWESLRKDFDEIMQEHDVEGDGSLASKLKRLQAVSNWYARVQVFVSQGLDMIQKVRQLKDELPDDDVLDYVLSIGSEA